MTLNDVLKRENNNFDLLRLIAAAAVIVGHAAVISGDRGAHDPVMDLMHFEYSGSLAVKFFFLLSGLVVTNSLLRNAGLGRFIAARIARVFPALLVVLLLSAYVMGPLLSTLPAGSYLSSRETLAYVSRNALLHSSYLLPGVFDNAPEHGVNGSIWTIPMEMLCYLGLAIAAGLGLTRSKIVFSLATVGVVTLLLLEPRAVAVLRMPPESVPMFTFFALGALLANWKKQVVLNPFTVLGLAIAAYLARSTPALPYLCCAAIFAAAICLSSTPLVRRLRLPGDYSYGIYLFGWPMQQLVHAALPDMGARGNWLLALPLAAGCGALSWYLVEKPCIQWGKKIGDFLPAGKAVPEPA
ncbi:acyltransferase family protein [Pseudoduganella violaceinigra]|uniref:acyltransferase family protein n=1 Tax=Pseudoduganella violaceinigra TaxID=246602 RepID=UPI0004154FC5|nr:acyltransferase [Pseudoduganella violaceinigra]